MSKGYTIATFPAAANRGRDDEFEIICKVTFNVLPREARTSTYPGAEPAIEDIGVCVLKEFEHCFPDRASIIAFEYGVIEDLEEDQSPLWEYVAAVDRDAREYAMHCEDEAFDRRWRERRDEARMEG